MIHARDLSIITLCENTASDRDIIGEWGLSFYVRAGDSTFLLDTGAGLSIENNADVMGADMKAAEMILLSHGHFDHTGGLQAALLKIGKNAVPVYGHPEIFSRRYSRKSHGYAYAGIPWVREELERLGAEFRLSPEPVWFGDDIVLSGEEPMTTEFEKISDRLVVRNSDGGYVQDTVPDDQSVFIKTDLGLVVLLGCAHRGMINILKYAVELTGMDKIHMVVGGTHLYPANDQQIAASIDALKKFGIEWIGVSHCTGGYAAVKLAAAFGDRFFFNNAGTVIRFPFTGKK